MLIGCRVRAIGDDGAIRRHLEELGCRGQDQEPYLGALTNRSLLLAPLNADAARRLASFAEMAGCTVFAGAYPSDKSARALLVGGSARALDGFLGYMGDAAEMSPLYGECKAVLGAMAFTPTRLLGRGATLVLDRPRIMGILNLTPDSFSDGGRFNSLDAAVGRAMEMVEEGADLIDVGGESTRPGAAPVSVEEELLRVVPIVEALARICPVPISVDTTKSAVAGPCLKVGAAFVNDVSGLVNDSRMPECVAEAGAGLFLMHTSGTPRIMQQRTSYQDLTGEIIQRLGEGVERALAAGVGREFLAVDPGIGFGKTVEGNLEILRRLGELRCLGLPILLGTSRKSFIGRVLGIDAPEERLYGSLATLALGVRAGASLFRVHDVRASRDVVRMAWAITQEGFQSGN